MLNKITAPIVLPITLEQVKAHLRLDHADEDNYLMFLIQSATEAVQNYVGRSLITQTWQKVFYQSQRYSCRISKQPILPIIISLPYPPLLKINSIMGCGVNKTPLAITRYDLKFNGDLALIEIDQSLERIEVKYDAGYGDRPEDIPADIRQAILQLTALCYQKRQSFPLEDEPYLVSLMQPYRIFRQV